MPTPERIRAATREKLKRVCVVCGASFSVKKTSHIGRTCSKPCQHKHNSNIKVGVKLSAETRARMSASHKAYRSDPDRSAKHTAAAAAGLAKWLSDPVNFQEWSARSSDRMKRLHTDPAFQQRRDARSSQTLKAVWETQREKLVAATIERNARHMEQGTGIWSPDIISKKNAAAKWIMRRAQELLRLETSYNETFAEVQYRLRREMPYDGPQDGTEYEDYCRKLGTAVVLSPECQAISAPFMSEAIPRAAEEYQRNKLNCSDAPKFGQG